MSVEDKEGSKEVKKEENKKPLISENMLKSIV
jgi:hypothetical protein